MQISNNLKKIVAMTLAEVLITMGIMGVVFALTVPTIKGNSDKRRMESLLQKSYTIVNQAIDMSLAKDTEDRISQWDFTSQEGMFNRLSKHISMQKICSSGSQECFATKYKHLSSGGYFDTTFHKTKSGIMSGDISFQFEECDGSECHLHVDLNGPKEPNVIGYDFFEFVLYKDDTRGLAGRSCGTDFCRTGEIMDNNWEIKYW